MSFDSLSYLLFLPVTALVHWLCPGRWRWIVLLAASLFFYASWNAPLTLLLLSVIAVTYLAGRALARTERPGRRRLILALAMAVCIGLMLYFKYFRFLAESLQALLRLAGHDPAWRLWDVILPVGLSFYAFQAMSYVIDVYRDPAQAETHPGYYALYISFFPQLVAGPIERAERLLPQLRAERIWERSDLTMGLRLLCSGYFRKLVIADLCGRLVTQVYAAARPDGSAVALATVLFGIQIYCDFAGYSEIAQGSARLLGVRLMRNFDRPYLSRSVREFWRRWHISLSRWFSDYLYIPLGGSRKGLLRQLAAAVTVFAVSGLWHGANWTFLAWGSLHGVYMLTDILWRRKGKPLPKTLGLMLTYAAVTFAWIFFRADSLSHAWFLLGRLFSVWDLRAGLSLFSSGLPELLWLLLALAQSPMLHRLTREDLPAPTGMAFVYLTSAAALAFLIRAEQSAPSAFIYFQF